MKIKAKVNRRGAKVFARKEYCNSRSSLNDSLLGTKLGKQIDAYASVAQPGEIPIAFQLASTLDGNGTNRKLVALSFPWQSLRSWWVVDKLYATIGITGLVHDSAGKLVSRFSDDECYMSPDNFLDFCALCFRNELWSRYSETPAAYQTHLDLPAGEYKLTFILSDGSKFGRVETPLNVEKSDQTKLSISDLILSKRVHEVLERDAQFHALVSKGMEFTPTTEKVFKNNERLFVYFEIYDPSLRDGAASKAQFQLRLVESKTGETKADSGLVSAAPWIKTDKAVIPIAREITIDDLAAGSYRLELKATDSEGGATSRTTTLSIENSP